MKFDIKELLSNKMFKMLLIVIMVIILIIVGISVFFAIKGTRVKSYEKLDTIVLNAGKKYYNSNTDLLPKEIGSEATVDATTLASEGYMKNLDNISPKGSVCTAEVKVINVNGNYHYASNLDCGSSYKSSNLTDYILTNEAVVAAGDGLYQDGSDYVYRGEYPNNYIEFSDELYRIVSINEDKSITIINSEREKTSIRSVWDDRYNPDRKYNDGINDYTVSRIKDNLLDYLNGESFTDSDRSMLMYQNLCIGKVGEENINRNQECSQTFDNQIVGLLPISNYKYASLDINCTGATSASCQNYNYLAKFNANWWTITGGTARTSFAYAIQSSGKPYTSTCSNGAYLREVLRLTNNVMYVSGNGTIESPYVIK